MQNNNSIMDEVIPTQFFLSQNYPNPFREKTMIKYCVPLKTNVHIAIYNTHGEMLRVLVNEIKNPGTYEVEFATCHSGLPSGESNDSERNLPDGYYFYKMVTEEFTSEIKWFCINKLSERFNMKNLIHTLFFFLLVTQFCFGQWYQQNSGTTKNFNSVQFISINRGWAVGDSGSILKTTDGGINWNKQTSGTNQDLLDVQFENENLGWAAGGSGKFWNPDSAILLKTTNGGLNWIKLLSIKGKFYDVCFTEYSGWLELKGHLVGSGEDIFGNIHPIHLRTTDGGNNWIPQYYSENFLSTINFIDEDTGWLVEITGGGFGKYGSVIRKTIDGGINWEIQYTNSAIYRLKSLNSDFICGVGSTVAWLDLGPLNSTLARTYDGGSTWIDTMFWSSSSYNGLKDISISSINVLTAVGFLDSTGSIFRSTDSGNTWSKQFFDQTGSLNGVSFIDDYTGWVVGNDGIILHTTNGGVTFINNEPIQLTEFLLEQNYPNPFNPTTVISYQLPVSGDVTLKVFDILGNEIATFVNEYKTAGKYEVEFNAASHSGYVRNLPSGVYFYQLRAGDFVSVKKMLLLK